MKQIFRSTLSLILIMTFLFSIYLPVFAGVGSGILILDKDNTNHQALKMSVDSVASTSSLQAFCVGWNFTFSNSNGSVSVYVPLSYVDTDGGFREYLFPLTTGWTLDYTGITGGQSIRDLVSNKTQFDNIIKAGCTVTANARVQKYSYSSNPAPKGTFTKLSTIANTATEIDSNFSEFSSTFKTNTKTDYYNLTLTLAAEPPYTNIVHFIYWDQASNTQMDISQADMVVTGYGSLSQNVTLVSIPAGYEIVGRIFKYSSSMPTTWADYSTWDKLLYFPLAVPNTEGWVHILLNKPAPPAPDTGRLHQICLDATGTELSRNTILNVPLGTAKTLSSPSLDGYTFKGSYKSFSSSIPAASNMQTGVNTQTITLTSINKDGYIYSWYDEILSPELPPLLPPIAFLNNTSVVYAGDDVFVDGSASYDLDGTISSYLWDLSGASQGLGNLPSGLIWYPAEGTYDVKLTVIDNSGLTDSVTGRVMILKPIPNVQFNVTAAKLKENRKIIFDVTSSTSPSRFPIDWSLTTWTIQPVSATGATGDYGVKLNDGRVYKNVGGIAYQYNSGSWINTGLSLLSIIKGQNRLEFQARDSGQYNVTATITNTANFNSTIHYSNSSTKTLNISEDLAPIAQFSSQTSTYREQLNPSNPTGQKYGIMPITCTSSSPDGDTIGTRNWTYKYDSDNDGSFTDEVTSYPYSGSSIFTSGSRLIVEGNNDNIVNISSYDVGKYTQTLTVIEDIPSSESITELLLSTDYRSSSANALNVSEIKNIAPTTGFDVTKRVKYDIVVVTDYEGTKNSLLKSTLNDFKAEMLGENVDIQLSYVATKKINGQQLLNITDYLYVRRAWVSFKETGRTMSAFGLTNSWNDRITTVYENYEEKWSDLPNYIPTGNIGFTKQVSVTTIPHTENSPVQHGWNHTGTYYKFYDPANMAGTQVQIDLDTRQYQTMPSGDYYLMENAYSNITYGVDNSWIKTDTSRNKQLTSDIKAVNFDYLSTVSSSFRLGSKKVMLIVSDNNSVDFINNNAQGYSFTTLNNTVKQFVINNDMDVFTVVPNDILDLKFNSNNHNTNISSQQVSLKELINSSAIRGANIEQNWVNNLKFMMFKDRIPVSNISIDNNTITIDLPENVNEDIFLGYYTGNNILQDIVGNLLPDIPHIEVKKDTRVTPLLLNGLVFTDALGDDKNGYTVIHLGNPSVAGNKFVYINWGSTPQPVNVGDNLSTKPYITDGSLLSASNGNYIGVAEVNSSKIVVRYTLGQAVCVNE